METATETETDKNHWSSAIHHAEKYAALKYELYKYEMIEKATLIGSSVTTSLINAMVLCVGIFLIILAAAFLVGETLGHTYLGFAVAGVFFFLCFFIMHQC